MKLDTPGKRIIFLRNLAGLTRKEFEEKYSIPIVTLRSWEVTEHIKSKAAQKFLFAIKKEGINCCLDWIMYGNGSFPSADNSLSMPATELALLGSNFDEDVSEEISFLQKKYKNIFSVALINNNDNFPLLNTGDYVGGVSSKDINNLVNHLCIIKNEFDVILIRQLIATRDHNEYHLKAYNQDSVLSNKLYKHTFCDTLFVK